MYKVKLESGRIPNMVTIETDHGTFTVMESDGMIRIAEVSGKSIIVKPIADNCVLIGGEK